MTVKTDKPVALKRLFRTMELQSLHKAVLVFFEASRSLQTPARVQIEPDLSM